MTEETKKLIESVQTYEHPSPLCFDSEPKILVKKSELIRVVEDLTKWNKVEYSLPKTGTKVLVRFKNGNWSTSERYISTGSGFEHWKGSGTFADSIIEWKYIN